MVWFSNNGWQGCPQGVLISQITTSAQFGGGGDFWPIFEFGGLEESQQRYCINQMLEQLKISKLT